MTFDFDKELDKLKALQASKRNDYASDEDPFKNLRICEALDICSVEKGILIRMTDKIGRLINLIDGKEVKVQDESIEDTCDDLSIYPQLLKCYRREKK